MAITYTWEVTGLKKKTEGSNNDAVVQTYWTKTGTDENDNIGTFHGATPFSSVEADPFIAFADLTEANVLGWIKAVANDGGSYEDHINDQIQKQIDDLTTPVVDAALPWAPVEEESEDPEAPADAGGE
jgi:hypothetical protein